MILSRRTRRFATWIAAFAVLASQVVVAAYACPYDRPAIEQSAMDANCASGMLQTDQPNLCKAHNDAPSKIKADNAPTSTAVAAFVVSVITPLDLVDISASRLASYRADRLAPDGSPPLFLRLLVLRD